MPRSKHRLNVTALPVAHGDALWVEYGDADTRHRILIDGGPASAYSTVHEWLDKLPPDERTLELLVVTHIDADHIDGAVILLQELDRLGIAVKDVWFNGWRHINDESLSPDVFGPEQGEFLGALIEREKLPWNVAFRAGAAAVPEEGDLPRVELAAGATITVLTPQARQLRRLRRNWHAVARDAGWTPGDADAALRRLDARKDYEPPAPVDVFGAEVFASDNSVANGSSIAFVFEHEGARCLFAGDAVPEVLADGLRRFAAQTGDGGGEFDLVKIAHHGSAKNIDAELVRRMPTGRYLISTSGARYRHPDRAAIELILSQSSSGPRTLYFNYESETTAEWADDTLQEQYDYVPEYPSQRGPGITVSLA